MSSRRRPYLHMRGVTKPELSLAADTDYRIGGDRKEGLIAGFDPQVGLHGFLLFFFGIQIH